MATKLAETATPSVSTKLASFFRSVADLGDGPDKTPYPDARELAGMMGEYMTVPTFAFGSFDVPVADEALDHIVRLDFEPKVVLALINSDKAAQDRFLMKHRGLGAGTPAEKECYDQLIGLAGANAGTFADFLALTEEGASPANNNAFTIYAGALDVDVTGRVVWVAFG